MKTETQKAAIKECNEFYNAYTAEGKLALSFGEEFKNQVAQAIDEGSLDRLRGLLGPWATMPVNRKC